MGHAISTFCVVCFCDYSRCHFHLWPDAGRQSFIVHVEEPAISAAGSLFATGILVPAVTRLYDDARSVLRNLTCLDPALCTNSTFPTTAGKATYDQQVSMIFTQDFQALSYNVTAVSQTDSSGYGPAYLLNGLSDTGYWYQVGLAYNWPLASGNGYEGVKLF